MPANNLNELSHIPDRPELGSLAPLVEPLTRREREVLALLAEGYSAPEIAEQLTIALSSVKTHIQNLYGKLGVNRKRQAIERAQTLGLLGTEAAESKGALAPPSGTVTFLFTDIEGSAKLLEQLRETYAIVLAEQRALLRAAFAAHNGREIDTQGDACFVAFPRALDAVRCVVQAQQALAAHPWPQNALVRVRMGLHTGEPLLARTGYVGMDVHRAARMGAAGHGGQVLISQTTRDLIVQDLPPHTTLRPLGEHRLKDIRYPQPIYQLDIEGLPVAFPPLKTLSSDEEPPTPGEAPFKGLQYFEEGDADWFFGREQATGQLAARVCAERFLAVIGASGSGKSSVVRAGLVPALKRAASPCPDVHWQIYVVTPTAQPLATLATSLTREAGSVSATAGFIDAMGADPRSLHLHIHERLHLDRRGARAAGQVRVLLVIDQFEELFTLCRDADERLAFVDNLLTAANAEGGGTSVVLALRADFYDHLAAYPGLSQAVAQHQEYLGAMTAGELRQAIEAPAARGGWTFSPGLVDLLLHDIGAGQGRPPEPGALPLLSHALLETWKRRRGSLLNLRAYTESGGVRGAIARTAEGVFQDELTAGQQSIARNIFLRLTELGEDAQDTRRRVSYDELSPGALGTEVEEVLDRLADARLITVGEGTVEVAHEALIREWPTLRQWLDEDREGLRLQRHLTEAAQAWAGFDREPSELYRGSRLSQAWDWAAAHPGRLNALEQEFLDASRALSEREAAEREAAQQRELEAAQQLVETAQRAAVAEQQRAETQTRAARGLRRRAYYLVGALVLALLAAGVAGVFGQRASRSAALANENAALANQNLSQAQAANTQAAAQQATALAEGRRADEQRATAITEGQRADEQRDAALAAQATAQSEADARATQQSIAEANFTRAEAQRLAAEANKLALANGTSELIALLALRSIELQYSPQGDAALMTAASLELPVRTFEAPKSGNVGVTAFSPDSRRLFTISDDGRLRVYDVSSTQPLQTIKMEGDWWADTYFTPDSQSVFIVTDDGRAQIWDIATGLLTQEFPLPDCGRNLQPVWPSVSEVLVGCDNHTIQLWDVVTGEKQDEWVFEDESPIPLHDGLRALSYSETENAHRLWDIRSGRRLQTFAHEYYFVPLNYPPPVSISLDDQIVAFTLEEGAADVWDTGSGQRLLSIAPAVAVRDRLAISPDGRYLLTAGATGDAGLWEIAIGREVRRFRGHTRGMYDLGFSPDGRLAVTANGDGTAKLWNVAPQPELPSLIGHQAEVSAVDLSPDGRFIATAGWDDTLRVWDAETGEPRQVMTGAGNINYGMRFSPDGTQIVTVNQGGGITLWDWETGQPVYHFETEGFWATNDVSFSPDGRYFATPGALPDDYWGKYVRVFDRTTGAEAFHFASSDTNILEFSPDGRYLATAFSASLAQVPTARLWDLETHEQVQQFSGHEFGSGIIDVDFSPDGQYLATAGTDGTARLWDVQTGQEVMRFVGHSAQLYGMALSRDGALLATASVDQTVRVWDVRTGQELRRFVGHTAAVENVVFSADGRRVISVSDDGTGRFWSVDYHATIDYLCSRLLRDLSVAERAQFEITDTRPTCSP